MEPKANFQVKCRVLSSTASPCETPSFCFLFREYPRAPHGQRHSPAAPLSPPAPRATCRSPRLPPLSGGLRLTSQLPPAFPTHPALSPAHGAAATAPTFQQQARWPIRDPAGLCPVPPPHRGLRDGGKAAGGGASSRSVSTMNPCNRLSQNGFSWIPFVHFLSFRSLEGPARLPACVSPQNSPGPSEPDLCFL